MVSLPLSRQKQASSRQRQPLCGHNGPPYAVQLPEEGEDEHGRALENQRPQKGDQGGGQPVVEGGEEGGAEDGEPREQEGDGENGKGPGRHGQKASVIAHEQRGKGPGQGLHGGEHNGGGRP